MHVSYACVLFTSPPTCVVSLRLATCRPQTSGFLSAARPHTTHLDSSVHEKPSLHFHNLIMTDSIFTCTPTTIFFFFRNHDSPPMAPPTDSLHKKSSDAWRCQRKISLHSVSCRKTLHPNIQKSRRPAVPHYLHQTSCLQTDSYMHGVSYNGPTDAWYWAESGSRPRHMRSYLLPRRWPIYPHWPYLWAK